MPDTEMRIDSDNGYKTDDEKETNAWIDQYTSELDDAETDELADLGDEEAVEDEDVGDSTVGQADVEVDEEDEEPAKPATNTELEKLTAAEAASRKALEELRASQKEFESKKANYIDRTQLSKMDPLDFMKLSGHPVEFVTKLLVAEQMKAAGKAVPETIQKELSDYYNKQDLRKLEARLAEKEQAETAATYYNKISSDARSYVAGLDEKAAPNVFMFKDIPDFLHTEVLGELQRDAQEKVARGEHNAELMSFPEALKAVEARFAPLVTAIKNHLEKKSKPESKPTGKGLPKQPKATSPVTAQKKTMSDDEELEMVINNALKVGARAALKKKKVR